MVDWSKIDNIRREYGAILLTEASALADPFKQFQEWFKAVIASEKNDPTAMVLSTVDAKGHPDSRVVLLKGIEADRFIFFTNYESTKACQLKANNFAALNFYWPEMARQVRIRGRVEKIPAKESDLYFSSRPKASQIAAIASKQSRPLQNRFELEEQYQKLSLIYEKKPVERPSFWGGYGLLPETIEFWQGRNNRLHDRLRYLKEGSGWVIERLSP